MSKRSNAFGWVLVSLCTASTLAQDVPQYENPYARKKQAKAPSTPVDGHLAELLIDKLSACYQLEQGKPMTLEDMRLLGTYAKDVTRDLAPALAQTSCRPDKPVSARCEQELSALSCEHLAQPIIEAGWDRHLTPEAKAHVARYARALARREQACSGRDGEEAAIVGEVQVDKLGVLIEMQIVTGRCELIPERLLACERDLSAMECADLAQLDNRGELIQACDALFRCREMRVDPDIK